MCRTISGRALGLLALLVLGQLGTGVVGAEVVLVVDSTTDAVEDEVVTDDTNGWSHAFLRLRSVPVVQPTATPLAVTIHGDVNCDRGVDSTDALDILKSVARLAILRPCSYIRPAGPGGLTAPAPSVGDVDCSGAVDAVDALKVLRYVAGLDYAQHEPCPDIGQMTPHDT